MNEEVKSEDAGLDLTLDLTLVLVDQILAMCKESGASVEQCLSAVRACEALLPVSGIASQRDITLYRTIEP